MVKMINFQPPGSPQQRACIKAELDELEESFSAQHMLLYRQAAGLPPYDADEAPEILSPKIEVEILAVVVPAVARALERGQLGDARTANRLARLYAPEFARALAPEVVEELRCRAACARQLVREPRCQRCRELGKDTAAQIADPELEPLRSLCFACRHDAWEAIRGYRTDIGPDGCPLDPRHPFNRGYCPKRRANR